MQKFLMIFSLEFGLDQNYFSIEFEFWWKKSTAKYAPDLEITNKWD